MPDIMSALNKESISSIFRVSYGSYAYIHPTYTFFVAPCMSVWMFSLHFYMKYG